MEIRSADETNAILSEKLDMFAANNIISKESLSILKEASTDSAKEGKPHHLYESDRDFSSEYPRKLNNLFATTFS